MRSQAISGGVAHTVPMDLRRVLMANPKVLAAWEDLTPLARNEWLCWVLWPKKAATRSQHIQRVQSELLEGKRRPCCWLGCIDRKDKDPKGLFNTRLDSKAVRAIDFHEGDAINASALKALIREGARRNRS